MWQSPSYEDAVDVRFLCSLTYLHKIEIGLFSARFCRIWMKCLFFHTSWTASLYGISPFFVQGTLLAVTLAYAPVQHVLYMPQDLEPSLCFPASGICTIWEKPIQHLFVMATTVHNRLLRRQRTSAGKILPLRQARLPFSDVDIDVFCHEGCIGMSQIVPVKSSGMSSSLFSVFERLCVTMGCKGSVFLMPYRKSSVLRCMDVSVLFPNVFCLPGFVRTKSGTGMVRLRLWILSESGTMRFPLSFQSGCVNGRQAALSDGLLSFDNPRHGNGWQITR